MGFFDNKIVTVFNKIVDPETGDVTYLPTVLENVDLVIKRSKTVTADGQKDTDAATLFVEDTTYFSKPKEWEALPEEERQQYFTFRPQMDFFVAGDLKEGYGGQSYEEMRSLHDDCYMITGVDYFEDILPHIEVGGR